METQDQYVQKLLRTATELNEADRTEAGNDELARMMTKFANDTGHTGSVPADIARIVRNTVAKQASEAEERARGADPLYDSLMKETWTKLPSEPRLSTTA
jgi:hypothetical protein